jgi:polysaccharide export outer membrane protein
MGRKRTLAAVPIQTRLTGKHQAISLKKREVLIVIRHGIILAIGVTIAIASNPAEAQQPLASPQAGPAYRINPGDEIEIMVWGEERLQRAVRVLPDGTFSFPLVGQVVAVNQLPSDLERIISAALQPQYRGAVPQVTVSVKNPAGYQFSVIGKVKAPGTFTPGRYVNALEALTMAGGPSEFASLHGATILRKTGRSLATLRLRLDDALSGRAGRMRDGDVPTIQTGDTLVVP